MSTRKNNASSSSEIADPHGTSQAWARTNALTLAPGQLLEMRDGSVWEVVENPKDGIWVVGKSTDAADLSTEMILLSDVVAVRPARTA